MPLAVAVGLMLAAGSAGAEPLSTAFWRGVSNVQACERESAHHEWPLPRWYRCLLGVYGAARIEAQALGQEYEAARWELLVHPDPAGVLTPTAQSFLDAARHHLKRRELSQFCRVFALDCATVRALIAAPT